MKSLPTGDARPVLYRKTRRTLFGRLSSRQLAPSLRNPGSAKCSSSSQVCLQSSGTWLRRNILQAVHWDTNACAKFENNKHKPCFLCLSILTISGVCVILDSSPAEGSQCGKLCGICSLMTSYTDPHSSIIHAHQCSTLNT